MGWVKKCMRGGELRGGVVRALISLFFMLFQDDFNKIIFLFHGWIMTIMSRCRTFYLLFLILPEIQGP
jgi:hypothetical protein